MNEEFDLWSSVYSKNRYHVVINKKYSMYVGNMLIGWTNCFESCIPISSPMRDGLIRIYTCTITFLDISVFMNIHNNTIQKCHIHMEILFTYDSHRYTREYDGALSKNSFVFCL
jgi:hypothetical protein